MRKKNDRYDSSNSSQSTIVRGLRWGFAGLAIVVSVGVVSSTRCSCWSRFHQTDSINNVEKTKNPPQKSRDSGHEKARD